MKKVFVVLASILFLASVVSATPIYVGSGSSIPSEFDSWDNVQGLITLYNGSTPPPDPLLPNLNPIYIGFEIPDGDGDVEYFEYSLENIKNDIAPIEIDYPVYISFKYATDFDLYFLENNDPFTFPTIIGDEEVWDHALSHYRVWSPQAVPEPATMLLLGTGLLGLGAISRKKVFKK